MNSRDYENNKLSYGINCDSTSRKIKLNHFFSKNYIDLIWGEKKIQLYKDSIFGYRDCKQNDFRFYNNYDHEYLILENKYMILYEADLPEPTSDGRRNQLVPNYFFSTSLTSAIIPLTLINLKKAFPDNIKFHSLLDIEFEGDKKLTTFDDTHKMYKINYLLHFTIAN